MKIWKEDNTLLREDADTRRYHKKNSTLTTKTIESVEKLLKKVKDCFCSSIEGYYSIADKDSVYECIFFEDCYDLDKKHKQIKECELFLIGSDYYMDEGLYLNPTIEFLNVLKFNDNAETLDYIKTYGFPLVIKVYNGPNWDTDYVGKVEFTSKAFDTKRDWDKIRQKVEEFKK